MIFASLLLISLATLYNWLPLIASVLVALISPGATCWIRRVWSDLPTLITPVTVSPPAKLKLYALADVPVPKFNVSEV